MNAHFLPFIQSRMPACGMVLPTLNEGLSHSFSHSGNTQNHTKVYFVAILNPLMLPWRLTTAVLFHSVSFDFMYIVRVLDMQVPEEDKKRAPSLYNLVS